MTADCAQAAGERLRQAIRDDLRRMPNFDPREELLLAAAGKQADTLDVLETDITERGTSSTESSIRRVHEARQGRLALGRLLAEIDILEASNITTLRGRRAAAARWRKAS
jgi:hypothetical protein